MPWGTGGRRISTDLIARVVDTTSAAGYVSACPCEQPVTVFTSSHKASSHTMRLKRVRSMGSTSLDRVRLGVYR